MKRIFLLSISFVLLVLFASTSEAQNSKPKITFIEIGSVNCVPCKKMQPIMKSLEQKYGEQLKIIFYDVWKKEHKDKAEKYGVKLIPTQIFQDENGKEIHRHVGFYPETEIDKFLQSKGLKPKS
ncbi:MAG: thioredoxin family protein [Bacteroidota bacterium]|jgi:thioredoxin 1